MKKNTYYEPKALTNLREFYKDYLSFSSRVPYTLTTELMAAMSDNEIEDAQFLLLYEKEGSLFCMEETGSDSEILHVDAFFDEIDIQQFFEKSENGETDIPHCFLIKRSGAWFDEANQIKGKVYTVLCIGEFDEKQSFLLRCFHEAYSEWIAQIILRIATPVYTEANFPAEYSGIKERILRETINIVEERLLTLYGIELNVISELAGSYYEGEKCNGALIFRMETSDIEGILFAEEDYVKIERKNVKRLRKLLEMCRGEHCLLAERYNQMYWVAKGLCRSDNKGGDIAFRILDHMCWEMEIGGQISLIYKNGKYLISKSNKKTKEFQETYKRVFGCDSPQYVYDFFEEARGQLHGTSIIILDKDDAEGDDSIQLEVKRLLENSSGISIESRTEIPREFVLGVTSIDGAVIMNRYGRVYAIGAILDGTAGIKGDPAHGARHNSVMKYITSKKEDGLKGFGIIFSEDKTIKFITTED